MDSTIFFRTSSEHLYMYDFSLGIFTLCHPLIRIFYLNEKNANQCMDNILDGYSEIEKKSIYKKYLYYKQIGYFRKIGKEYYRKFHPKEIEHSFYNPSNIVFEITDACNLKCEYCCYGKYYGDYSERIGKYMEFNTIKIVLDSALRLYDNEQDNSNNITIGFYGGEPLMNMEVITETVEYLRNISKVTNHKVEYMLTTNATLLHKHINFLVENDFKLTISLDGSEYNNSYRVYKNGKGSFSTVIKNLSTLAKTYPDYFKSNVEFNSVLHNRNSIETIYEFIKTEFNKTPRISEVSNIGIKAELKSDFLKLHKSYSSSFEASNSPEDIIKSLFLEDVNVYTLTLLLYWYGVNQFKSYGNILKSSFLSETVSTGTCIPFGKKIFVTINNEILPCEKVGSEHSLGIVNDRGCHVNWVEVAEKYNSYFDQLYKQQCSKCYRSGRCTKCIFQIPEDLFSKGKCDGMHSKQRFASILKDCITLLEDHPVLFNRIITEANLK